MYTFLKSKNVIVVKAEKRNVFLSWTDERGRVKLVFTPGLILKEGVTRAAYNELSDRFDRRKKRNLRAYINNEKKSRYGIRHTTVEFLGRIIEKLKKTNQKILVCCVHITGSNLRVCRSIVKILKQVAWIKICAIRLTRLTAHGGCRLKIKKRKKNKGRNRWAKRIRFVRSTL